MSKMNNSSSASISGKGKPGFFGAISRFFTFAIRHSWGGRIGAMVGFLIVILRRIIPQDEDGNLLITVMILLICGMTGVIIEKIVLLIKKLLKKG
ncbi:hypothetical protein FACS1894181_12290 [Bacteroidia bacterium]|nr:hypothetical protein FACS1894181_12290 [Bacteroidia bacterium]